MRMPASVNTESSSAPRVSGTVTSMRIVEDDSAVKVRLAVNVVAENGSPAASCACGQY
jgi:hypothetical protein